ncbi:MAG: hypothetical protein ACD_26C00097G0002 [uncultured bacterium]|uniref:Radical SAM domain-containing protein n=1 Tax=Candidatus Uhrbacteria bacterium GW2011_GWC1_41_20 TaxID=1618983 RepID=A0A0G0VBL1_9BACT|nr:MAG: hypothetical protein ACD_26C00097G0002 [uncultured bacterium]KKR22349.1 MAG: Radical SAM domain-containing protein [Candidatus Uhrbacteria bacterium GW2011_GWE1_39_46]KKR63563.1 MAG: Radical SAM domain-containing protein [Candidatus Uhrbacteria bacterium GW2011_GWC2_40_450]KKR89757.1 MAG: Radical SAM domain-containing protein [Candidatus Uhrbacteria bacterium GW2011_GWD2_41_121]KKR98318.1 MAG: Radical SAM domain-containing protein [Candidatus Uhrbacteria bacterium GW2011_GWC1_41_20]KKS
MFKKIYWEINKKYYSLQKSTHELKSISLEITGMCNLHCKHCYMNSKQQSSDDLTTEEWKIFIDQVYKYFGNKINLGITGGEPLIRSDLLEILEHMKKLGFNVNLTTNGVLLDERIVKHLKKNIFGLSISLDGLVDSHNYLRQSDVFTKTTENIKLCKKNNIKYLIVKTAIYKNNLNELKDLYEIIKNIGVDEWHLFAVEPLGRAKLNKNEILSPIEYGLLCEFVDKLKNDKMNIIKIRFGEEGSNFMYSKSCDYCKFKLCNAGISSCVILYNGDIVNCMQSNRDDVQGNVKTDDFKKIWDTKFIKNREKNYTSCNKHYF